MKTTIVSLALLTTLALSSCGKDRSVGTVVNGTNQAGLDVTFVPTRLDDRWAIGQLHLHNTSAKPIQVTNFHVMNSYPNFKFTPVGGATVGAVDDAGYNPWTGGWHNSGNGDLVELPAGVAIDMTLKWRLLTKPQKNAPWTLSVGGLQQDGKPLPDVVLKSL